MPHLCETLAQTLSHHREALVVQVARSFPGACRSQAEDAVDEAILSALVGCAEPDSSFRRAVDNDGEAGLLAMTRTAAWRHLRGQLRRKASRVEHATDTLPEPVARVTPLDATLGRELAGRLEDLLRASAALHAKRDPAPLIVALEDRLRSGDTDIAVARRHPGVRRETLSRARCWMQSQLPTA